MSSNTSKTILLLAANPKDTTPLRLDEEVREIGKGLQRAKHREQFVLEQKWAVCPRDIQRSMLDIEPQIVHFSGHGTGDEGLVFEDEAGIASLVDGEALAGLFELFADQVECVVLNGCYSEVQASAIAQHVNYVIGMNKAICDQAAIEFAVGFYDALGAGRPVEFAYKFGCAAIRLARNPEQLTPVLKKKPGIDEAIVKISSPSNQSVSTKGAASFASTAPIEVFFSYSHQDEQLRDELTKHLSILKREGIITAWYDREISAGTEWAGEIDAHLNTAQVILLLISADFLASDYCYDIELTRAMERHAAQEACVIPVILREVDWKGAPFEKLQALPKNALPVNNWANRDQAFADIAREIREAIERISGVSRTGVPEVDPIAEVRSRLCQKIRDQHSKIRLLNLNEIGVDQLYVDVWVLGRLSSSLQVMLESFYQTFDLRGDRIGMGDRSGRKAGFTIAEIKPKLLILGKPGAGKTTFLKHLAVDCCNNKFQPNLIPVFLELRRIQTQEYDLLLAIHREFGLSELQQTEQLLQQGKSLILLDGLDEVSGQYRQAIQNHIHDFVQRYGKNRFILTCRTSILECPPQGFECVEVADFQSNQVEEFVRNWFKAGGMDDAMCDELWNAFNGRLKESPAVHELTVTPVVLSLMCWVFEDAGDLPTQRSQLYRKGLDLLLKRWDKSRDIQREVGSEIYRKLSLNQKESLLNELAVWKFTQPENFVLFEQAKLVEKITRILKLDDEEEGEGVLKAIEAHHGLLVQRADELWSFSHLTFQEYFTTQWFIQRQEWQKLACKIWIPHWREVFLLATEQREYSTEILWAMKAEIDQSNAADSKLQEFLAWAQQKSESAQSQYRTAEVRAFYFDLAYEFSEIGRSDITRSPRSLIAELMYDLDISRPIAFGSKLNTFRKEVKEVLICLLSSLELSSENIKEVLLKKLGVVLNQKAGDIQHEKEEAEEEELKEAMLAKERLEKLYKILDNACDYILALNRHSVLDRNAQNPMSLPELIFIQTQLPGFLGEHFRDSLEWWETNGKAWKKQLERALIKYCNIGHDWQFTTQQKEQLRRYYDANKFLVECMYQPGAVNETVKIEIGDSLLLPIAELQRQQGVAE